MRNWLFTLFICCSLMGCKESQPSATSKVTTNPQEMEGKIITIRGTAQNSKAGAMVGQYFIGGMQAWPEEVIGKKVEVKGSLHLVQHKAEDLVNSKGEVSQGMVGEQHVLEKPTWRILKD